jgi:hypothetical protein
LTTRFRHKKLNHIDDFAHGDDWAGHVKDFCAGGRGAGGANEGLGSIFDILIGAASTKANMIGLPQNGG